MARKKDKDAIPLDGLLERQSAQEIRQHYYFFATRVFSCQMSLPLHHYPRDLQCADIGSHHLHKGEATSAQKKRITQKTLKMPYVKKLISRSATVTIKCYYAFEKSRA